MSGVDGIMIKTFQEVNDIVIEIIDNGKALTQEAREALTTPFFSTQELGVGLGLPLCKTILEKYGNRFLMETPAEGGTKYTLRLKINKEEVSHGEATSSG